jgi:hypothetical protein
MGSNTPCHFCMQLPVAPSSRVGRISRCPLCKSTILEGAGGTCRVEDIIAAKPASKRGVVLGSVAGLVLSAALVFWHFQRETSTEAPIGSETATAASVLPRAQAKPMAEAYPVAVVKESSLRDADAMGQAKPQTYPVPPPPPPPAPVFRPTAQVNDAKSSPVIVAKSQSELRDKLGSLKLALDQARTDEARLREALLKVPEVTLVSWKDAKKELAMLTPLAQKPNQIKLAETSAPRHQTRVDLSRDRFIHWVKQNRAELDGLPYLLGGACQLDGRKTEALVEYSIMARKILQEVNAKQTKSKSTADVKTVKKMREEEAGKDFWTSVDAMFKKESSNAHSRRFYGEKNRENAQPALMQIVGPVEAATVKRGTVQYLASLKNDAAIHGLTRLALFELDPDIRVAAVAALRESRPQQHYVDQLFEGFNYPWAPASTHAAQALVQLHGSYGITKKELLPRLLALLEQPDPCEPFVADPSQGKVVRELVRINHHRNCILCHAAATPDGRSSLAVQIPSPDEPLPPSFSFKYYAAGRGLAVRPDITYLRQDFSVMQPVKDLGLWPEMQRFDFLVRTRLARTDEIQLWEARRKADEISDHRQAILWAVREISSAKK